MPSSRSARRRRRERNRKLRSAHSQTTLEEIAVVTDSPADGEVIQMPKKTEQGKNKRNHEPHKATLMVSIGFGLLLAFWVAFAPDQWGGLSDINENSDRGEMVGLIAASMALSILLLTINNSGNLYIVAAYAGAGTVAWMAAFITPNAKSLSTAAYMVFCTTPLVIAMIGLFIPKFTKRNAGLYLLIAGVLMLASSFVFSGTRLGVFAYGVLSQIWDDSVSEGIVIAISAGLGIAGILVILVVLVYGYAVMQGKAASVQRRR